MASASYVYMYVSYLAAIQLPHNFLTTVVFFSLGTGHNYSPGCPIVTSSSIQYIDINIMPIQCIHISCTYWQLQIAYIRILKGKQDFMNSIR